MLLPYIDIILIFICHFLGDFVLQTRDIATHKSTNNKVLAFHCILYGIAFLFFGLLFAVITGILHFMIDYFTSRLTTKFWKQNRDDLFWLTIGVDQMLHMVILTVTYMVIL